MGERSSGQDCWEHRIFGSSRLAGWLACQSFPLLPPPAPRDGLPNSRLPSDRLSRACNHIETETSEQSPGSPIGGGSESSSRPHSHPGFLSPTDSATRSLRSGPDTIEEATSEDQVPLPPRTNFAAQLDSLCRWPFDVNAGVGSRGRFLLRRLWVCAMLAYSRWRNWKRHKDRGVLRLFNSVKLSHGCAERFGS